MRKHEPASARARRGSRPAAERGSSLARALALAGSPAALAAILGVRPDTVRRWIRDGITPGGTKLLAELRERLKLQEVEERGKRQTFDLLFKLAGERGDLRRGKSREGMRAGPRTSGYQWVRAFSQMLTDALIEQIDAWVLTHRRRFPYWQLVAVATEYTKQKFKGYKTVMKQVPGVEESGDFAVEEQIATRRSSKLSEVRGELSAKLEDVIEEGALVYIHEVTVFNYRLRTDEERLAWEAGKRSSRKKRAKRRAKRSVKKAESWKSKKTTSKKSSKQSKKSVVTKTKATLKKSTLAQTKSKKPVASRSKNASTRLQPTRSNSRRVSAKKSAPKTSALRSRLTTLKKSTRKPKSSLATSKSRATSAKKTPQQVRGKQKTLKTATKAMKKTRR